MSVVQANIPSSSSLLPSVEAPARQPISTHPQGVLHLNNLLQRIAKHGATRWVDRATGPQNELTWTSRLYSAHLLSGMLTAMLIFSCSVDDVEYGERSGRTKQIARDLAAEDAYNILSREYGHNS